MRILVVEDDKPVRDLLMHLCSREGHEVSGAGSAGEALVLLRDAPFELLITDIIMPGLDGLALIRRAKAIQPEIMPIVLTGHTGNYTLEDILAAGASDLILKPFRTPELRARLKLAGDQLRTLQQLKAQERTLQTASTEMIDVLRQELKEARQAVARLSAVVARGDEPI
jgi:two-component system NtrC family response regulator